MRSFLWEGVRYPIPPGWVGLSMKAWFRRCRRLQSQLMRIERQARKGEKTNELHTSTAAFLRDEAGFQNRQHFEAFVAWGNEFWTSPGDDI